MAEIHRLVGNFGVEQWHQDDGDGITIIEYDHHDKVFDRLEMYGLTARALCAWLISHGYGQDVCEKQTNVCN